MQKREKPSQLNLTFIYSQNTYTYFAGENVQKLFFKKRTIMNKCTMKSFRYLPTSPVYNDNLPRLICKNQLMNNVGVLKEG